MIEDSEHWTPPDGLGYSSLRPVKLTGTGIALLVCAAAALLGGAVAGFLLDRASRRQNVEAQLLSEQGVRTNAQITRVWRTGGNAKNRNAEARNRVAYAFEHAGRRYSHSTQVPYKIWTTLHEGDSLPVRFVSTRPEISHPVEWDNRRIASWVPFLAGGMMMFIAPVFLFPLRRQYLLLAEGRPAPGKIKEIKKSDKTLVVKFDFRLLNGATASGKANVSKAPTDPLCVLYEADNPGRYGLYPFSLVRLENVASRRGKG